MLSVLVRSQIRVSLSEEVVMTMYPLFDTTLLTELLCGITYSDFPVSMSHLITFLLLQPNNVFSSGVMCISETKSDLFPTNSKIASLYKCYVKIKFNVISDDRSVLTRNGTNWCCCTSKRKINYNNYYM